MLQHQQVQQHISNLWFCKPANYRNSTHKHTTQYKYIKVYIIGITSSDVNEILEIKEQIDPLKKYFKRGIFRFGTKMFEVLLYFECAHPTFVLNLIQVIGSICILILFNPKSCKICNLAFFFANWYFIYLQSYKKCIV